jgi:soluble lytic murein transglycosylase-like protein
MLRNRKGYILLYFLSFCISTGVFHAVANAQEAANSQRVTLVHPFSNAPSPTVHIESPAAITYQSIPTSPTSSPSQNEPTTTPQAAESKEEAPTPTPTVALPTATPEPTAIPTPAPTNPPAPELEAMFDKYSSEYGADKELMKKIARCESGFNTTSNNSGMYLGMYQFSSSTWSANRNRMGLDPNPDLRTNPEEAIRTAAYMISKGGQGHWPNCH